MIEEFEYLGLSHYGAKALAVLMKDKFSLRLLSKKAEIPFGKIYSVIKELKARGFVSETNSRPKLVYVENASEVISRLIAEKQNREKGLNERVREMASLFDNAKGKETRFFDIGTTQKDNGRIQLRSFNEAEREILQIINIHHKPKSNRENKNKWERAHLEAIKRGVVTRAIYPKGIILPRVLQEMQKKYPENYKVRRLDSDFTRCDIVDGKKVLLKLVQQDPMQFGGVFFIENEKLADNLTNLFNQLWEQAEA